MSKKSVQENVQVQFPKTDARYWKSRLYRNTYTNGEERGETSTWCVKIGHQGHRETFNLKTPNAAAAASKAAGIYRLLVSAGWEAALAELKPKKPKQSIVTVGDFITIISECRGETKPATFVQYLRCFRRLIADIADIDRADLAKFDYVNGKNAAWKARVDAVKISKITPDSVRRWMHAQFTAELNPLEIQRKKIAVNAVVTKVRSLWSKGRLKMISDTDVRAHARGLDPTEDVDLFEEPDLSYRAKFDPAALLAKAQTELLAEPVRWLAFVLLLFGGMRRQELDMLLWRSVDLTQGIVNIETNDFFSPKSATSTRQIHLPAEVVELLKQWQKDHPGEVFVIPSPRLPPPPDSREYRCDPVFKPLIKWLRDNGVDGNKPIHTLRKAAGDLINQQFGLLAASRFLGHSDTRVTGRFYADGRGAVVGLGSVLINPTSALMGLPRPIDQASQTCTPPEIDQADVHTTGAV